MGAGESMKFVFTSRGTKMLVAATVRFSDRMGSYMSLGVVADRRLRTRTSNYDLLKTITGFFATVEPILGVLG